MIERSLRSAAVVIAVLALIDPPLTVSGRSRPRISVVATQAGAGIRDTPRGDLRQTFEIVDGLDSSAAAAVVVGDRYPDAAIPETMKVSTVSLDSRPARGVRIAQVNAPKTTPPATSIRLEIDVRGFAMRGATSTLVVRSRGAEVARAEHTWPGDRDDELWHATLDVVPVGEAPYTLSIGVDGGAASISIDAAPRMRVFVFEARPGWATAFVRRALEGDPRFEVSGTSAVAPRALVASGLSPALPRDLGQFDAIVVGGLDRASPVEVETLERFATERGGAVLLLPDAKLPKDATRLLPGVELRETLLERPAALQGDTPLTLEASELLEAAMLPPASSVVARAPSSKQPVVWTVRSGDGVVAVSGAMDAWRYRGPVFDRFWRSLVSGLALAARPPIEIAVSPRRVLPGERVRVTARVRKDQAERGIRAAVGGQPLRLWPEAEQGVFTGSFVADSQERTVVTASLDGSDVTGRARITIDEYARTRSPLALAMLAQSRGGIDVGAGDLNRLERHLRDTVDAPPARAERRPMRSPWWLAPFAACLSTEWWLRRRRGAR